MPEEEPAGEICLIELESFRGPLALLLHLIRKEKIDILDLPMARITRQYLDYLELMRALNISVAGEYLVMAATLIHIKSRMLLPSPEPEQEEDDPRLEIVRPLLELSSIQEAARFLNGKVWLERDVFARDGSWEILEAGGPAADGERDLDVGLFELVEAFRKIMAGADQEEVFGIRTNQIRLADRIEEILALLARFPRLTLTRIVGAEKTRLAMVITLLALLELAKAGSLCLEQEEPGGEITILRRRGAEPDPAAL